MVVGAIIFSKVVKTDAVWSYTGQVSATRLVTRRLSAELDNNLVWDHGVQRGAGRAGEGNPGEQKPYFVPSFSENKRPLWTVIPLLSASQFLPCSRAGTSQPQSPPITGAEPDLELLFSRLAACLRISAGRHWPPAG